MAQRRFGPLWAAAGALAAIAGLLALVVQPGVVPRPSQPPTVDASRLHGHVRVLSVEHYPRSHEQARNLERTASYIETQLRASGAAPQRQVVLVEGERYANIVARFGPREGPLIVIGAHYDAHGDASAGAKYPRGWSPDTHTPGADDNASGIAGLLELARLLAEMPPALPVELVAYTLEEPPHFRTPDMGSAWHARALRQSGRPVRLMLSLEMIGRFSDAPGSQRYPLPGMTLLYPGRGDFIGLVGRFADFGLMREAKALAAGATPLPVRSINAPPLLVGVDFSDHLSYWSHDYPAIMVTDTAFYRNSDYHGRGDTHDKLDYTRMAQVVQAVHAVATGLR